MLTGNVSLLDKSLLYGVKDQVNEHLVSLLYPFSSGAGDHNLMAGQTRKLSAITPKESHCIDTRSMRCLEGGMQVSCISACAEQYKHITGLPQALDLAAEQGVETVVIAYTGQSSRIGGK
jgi:hypothetical protein